MKQLKKHSILLVIMIMVLLAPITKIKSLAGSNLSTADPISIGSTVAGTLQSGKSTYYKFALAGNTCIKLYAKTGGHNQHVSVTVMDSTGAVMKCSSFFSTSDEANWGFQSGSKNYALNAGVYYIEVCSSYGGASFSLNMTATAVSGNSVVVAGQNNKYLGTAAGFTLGNTLASVAYDGFNGFDWDACHYYGFTLTSTQNVQFQINAEFKNSSQHMTFYLLNANGGRISQGISLSYDKNRTGTFNQMLNAGTYYIEATAFAHNIPYTIITSGTAPVINVSRVSGVKVSSPSKGRISIRWKTTSCTGYQVQISRSKYFLGRIYQRTYTTRYASYWGRKGMSRGKKYYVRVRAYTNAYGRTVYGSWSSVKSVKIRKW